MFPLNIYFLLGVGRKSCFILDGYGSVKIVLSMSHFEKQKDNFDDKFGL